MDKRNVVSELVAVAIHAGADGIEVERRDGFAEVVAMRGPIGFAIATLESNSSEGLHLWKSLSAMARKRTRIRVASVRYQVKVERYESFGDHAFRLEFRQV